ncbi:MAG: hypothetical protein ACE5EI_04595 [Thermodesulfobacteriota bacterium]
MKKRLAIMLLLFASAAVLAGCNASVYTERFVPREADGVARKFIRDLVDGDFAGAEAAVFHEFVTPELDGQLRDVHDRLSASEVVSVRLVKYNNIYKHAFTHEIVRSFLFYEVKARDGWFEVQTVVDNDSGARSVYGFFIEPASASLADINAFTLRGKSLRQYTILLLAVAVPLFIIYVFILCLRSRTDRKKSWLVVILLGVGSLTVNWTTGAPDWGIMSVSFLGIEPLRDGLDGPWMISVAMPIGAILFYLRWRRFLPAARGQGGAGEGGSGMTDLSGQA